MVSFTNQSTYKEIKNGQTWELKESSSWMGAAEREEENGEWKEYSRNISANWRSLGVGVKWHRARHTPPGTVDENEAMPWPVSGTSQILRDKKTW